jgi:hypothetical protein
MPFTEQKVKRISAVLASLPGVALAQELVAVAPEGSLVPVIILVVCACVIGGVIFIKSKRPALYAKLAGTAAKAADEVRRAREHLPNLAEEAKDAAEALLHHPLAQPKNPAQATMPANPLYALPHTPLSILAPPAVLEVPPSATVDDGILR